MMENCLICGEEFKKRKSKIYCSQICGEVAYYKRLGKTLYHGKCLCGCGNSWISTKNNEPKYIKGHDKPKPIYHCELCSTSIMNENELYVMNQNNSDFKFCKRCYENIKLMSVEK